MYNSSEIRKFIQKDDGKEFLSKVNINRKVILEMVGKKMTPEIISQHTGVSSGFFYFVDFSELSTKSDVDVMISLSRAFGFINPRGGIVTYSIKFAKKDLLHHINKECDLHRDLKFSLPYMTQTIGMEGMYLIDVNEYDSNGDLVKEFYIPTYRNGGDEDFFEILVNDFDIFCENKKYLERVFGEASDMDRVINYMFTLPKNNVVNVSCYIEHLDWNIDISVPSML